MATSKQTTDKTTTQIKTLPSVKGSELDLAVDVALGRKGAVDQLDTHPDVHKFGDEMRVFSQSELDQLRSLQALVVQYVQQIVPARPLCLAVFGPPGSGKSYSVKQIRKVAAGKVAGSETQLPMTTVNLTQISDPTSISAVLARVAGEQDDKTVPIIFFDEFDTARDGSPLGWLSWFLAPMHDGEFIHSDALVRLKRVVYVFAGGTASTMEEFSNRPLSSDLRAAKLPDFVSRLRAYLDVRGPNSPPRSLRRAVLLRKELSDKAKRVDAKVQTSDDVLRSLLQAGRYRHGARSVSAVVELCDVDRQSNQLDWGQLPEDHLLELHVDRGPLDERRINGSIALSGYQVAAKSDLREGQADLQDLLLDAWLAIAKGLWEEGATLAYAGNWHQDSTPELMSSLVSALKHLPMEPSRVEEKRAKPSPRLRSFLSGANDAAAAKAVGQTIDADDQCKYGMALTIKDYLPNDERKVIGEPLAINAVAMFRQRLDTAESSVARVAIGGSMTTHKGRMPGVADEVVISLAMGHPLYIAGGWGGAAEEIGRLLALGGTRSGEVDVAFSSDDDTFRVIAEKFRPSPWSSLPVTAKESAAFLKERALGSKHWPENGLSAAENKLLFRSQSSEEVVGLIVTGLRRRFRADG